MASQTIKDWMTKELASADVSTLRELVSRYPYVGPLRMMLAHASERSGDLERREDLLRAGAHVPSRSALLAYFMGPALLQEAKQVHQEVERMEEVEEEELVGLVWHSQENSLPRPQEDEATDQAPDEPSVQEPTSRDNMVAAIASVIESEVQEWTHDEPTEVPEDSEESSKVAIPEVGSEGRPQSLFGLWLQQRARETNFGSQQHVEQGAGALIDAFLAKGDVRIGPVRDALQSTEEWAQQGLVEDPSLVTETMAKLYASQGQMSRARKAYKLLALKYPEKSVYFAAQLKKLRNS